MVYLLKIVLFYSYVSLPEGMFGMLIHLFLGCFNCFNEMQSDAPEKKMLQVDKSIHPTVGPYMLMQPGDMMLLRVL